MSARPKLLDLFCGAGGASMGYYRAGFAVTGVDLHPQPRYPFTFIQADALEYLAAHGHEYDAIAASPPCQRYSVANRVHGSAHKHPDLIGPVRISLSQVGKPWVIENVVGAPLLSPTMFCGTMFGLMVYRHRLFESNVALHAPKAHRKHTGTANSHRWGDKRGGAGWNDLSGGYVTVCGGGNCTVASARRAMGIGWMTKKELNQAIPPDYTECIGRQLIERL